MHKDKDNILVTLVTSSRHADVLMADQLASYHLRSQVTFEKKVSTGNEFLKTRFPSGARPNRSAVVGPLDHRWRCRRRRAGPRPTLDEIFNGF